ncbi:MAG: sugar phosphate isomerase/epimerase [Oscillospiraceae bacterium]|nr:sugar phosphate isomerase/epimerase [Oscillospiraceae bacterium]
MSFGLCSFSYRWAFGRPYYKPEHPMTIDVFLDKTAEFGLRCAMLCNNTEWNTFSKEQLRQIHSKSSDLGISLDLGLRETDPDQYFLAFEEAKLLDASVMRFVFDMERSRDPAKDQAEFSRFRRLLDQIVPAAENAGIILAMENGPFLLHNEIKELIEDYNSPNLGACLDTMNCAYAIYRAEEVFEALAPYAKMVHLKDFFVEPNKRGYIFRGTSLGNGMLDVNKLIGYLKGANYTGNSYLELYIDRKENESDTFEYEEGIVRDSIAYAKSIGLV